MTAYVDKVVEPVSGSAAGPPCPAAYHGVPCVKPLYVDSSGECWGYHAGGHIFMTEEQQRRLDADPDAARQFLANARPVPKAAITDNALTTDVDT